MVTQEQLNEEQRYEEIVEAAMGLDKAIDKLRSLNVSVHDIITGKYEWRPAGWNGIVKPTHPEPTCEMCESTLDAHTPLPTDKEISSALQAVQCGDSSKLFEAIGDICRPYVNAIQKQK